MSPNVYVIRFPCLTLSHVVSFCLRMATFIRHDIPSGPRSVTSSIHPVDRSPSIAAGGIKKPPSPDSVSLPTSNKPVPFFSRCGSSLRRFCRGDRDTPCRASDFAFSAQPSQHSAQQMLRNIGLPLASRGCRENICRTNRRFRRRCKGSSSFRAWHDFRHPHFPSANAVARRDRVPLDRCQ